MYIAVETYKNRTHYILRESCTLKNRLTYRNLYNLGTNPAAIIKYPGGNSFYFDEAFEADLTRTGAHFDDDQLEDLFWHWIRPDIRRAVDTFRSRGKTAPPKLSKAQQDEISRQVHPFDKRRAHYLKFGNMDQGPVENIPAAIFRNLAGCCRDEIEQLFIKQELRLKDRELKSYVYAVFDLQSYFQGFMAKKMPQALDQNKVDRYFAKELCNLNKSLFGKTRQLDHYMIRYAVMFFDHQYADTRLLDEMAKDFMFRHHFHEPQPPKNIPTNRACKVFKITKKELAVLTKSQLTRKYRKLARDVHPDTGGSHDAFVELNDAYKTLLDKIKR